MPSQQHLAVARAADQLPHPFDHLPLPDDKRLVANHRPAVHLEQRIARRPVAGILDHHPAPLGQPHVAADAALEILPKLLLVPPREVQHLLNVLLNRKARQLDLRVIYVVAHADPVHALASRHRRQSLGQLAKPRRVARRQAVGQPAIEQVEKPQPHVHRRLSKDDPAVVLQAIVGRLVPQRLQNPGPHGLLEKVRRPLGEKRRHLRIVRRTFHQLSRQGPPSPATGLKAGRHIMQIIQIIQKCPRK